MQCQAEILLDRSFFGTCFNSTAVFTNDHRALAQAYQWIFWVTLEAFPGLTSMKMHHRFTRTIYEYLLNDDRLPFPSILSPCQAYSHPKAGVSIYVRPTDERNGYIDVQVGDITYVLEYGLGIYLRESILELQSLIFLLYT